MAQVIGEGHKGRSAAAMANVAGFGEVQKMDAAIRKANERYGILSNDEIAQRMYERREMALYDMNTLKRTAMRQGMEKGGRKVS